MGMKIAITGHTKGLGSEITKHFAKDHEVIGFSRTNGYDIKSPMDRKKILKASVDADVFINLVHNYYHQTDLLLEFFREWEHQDKLIINISSMVVEQDDWEWGKPITALSAICGCSFIAFSISAVPRRWPDTFSKSSIRPVIQ